MLSRELSSRITSPQHCIHCGYDLMGTPTSGDQGGDLIAKKDRKRYVISE